MKNFQRKPAGAKEKFGVTVRVDKKLDKSSGKSLFPEKLEKMNKILAGLSAE